MEVADIQALLNRKDKAKQSPATGHAYVRNPKTGGLDKVARSTLNSVGHFEGKQGTPKRSRKGQITIQANGRRFYCPNFDVEVISYTS